MIKSKVGDFYTLHENLATFLVDHSTEIIGKAAVIINYNFRVIHDALVEYITERDKIITKYSTKDENNNPIGIPAEDTESLKAATAEIEEINNLEIEVPIITMPIEELYKVADLVSSANVGALIWMTDEYQESLKPADKEDKK